MWLVFCEDHTPFAIKPHPNLNVCLHYEGSANLWNTLVIFGHALTILFFLLSLRAPATNFELLKCG